MDNINIGDEITINGTVISRLQGENRILIETANGDHLRVNKTDINTIHPYKEPCKEDHRKGN